jgi:ketosteroid isomerase-like protein
MSQENVEIVRKALGTYNAFMRGDLEGQAAAEAMAEVGDPQFEWRWRDEQTFPDAPQRLRGVAAMRGFWQQVGGAWVDVVLEPLEFIDATGDRVLVSVRQSGRGRESGVPVEFHFFQVFTIRDGRVWRVEIFRHKADALEAAGLPE